jgi:hypothetical protein
LATAKNGARFPAACLFLIALVAFPAYAQYEVAEIPFFDTPKGTAALGGGLRLGQDLYIAARCISTTANISFSAAPRVARTCSAGTMSS